MNMRIVLSILLLFSIPLHASTHPDNGYTAQEKLKPGLYEFSNKDYQLRKLDDGKFYIAYNGEVKNEYRQINGMLDLSNVLVCAGAASYTVFHLIAGKSWLDVGYGFAGMLAGAASTYFISKDMPTDQHNKYQSNISQISTWFAFFSVLVGLHARSSAAQGSNIPK